MEGLTGFPQMDPGTGSTLFAPQISGPGHWVGAPCVHVYDRRVYLTVRRREPRRRGHTLFVYERTGLGEYEAVVEFSAADLGGTSVERPALVTDPETGNLKLYVPVDAGANDWRIRKLADVDAPAAFDPSTATDVLVPSGDGTDCATVKDPSVVVNDGRYYMFYAGHDGDSEQAHLATSRDGETWRRSSMNPVLESSGWHDHHTRISCVVPAPRTDDWLVYYDGSGRDDYGRTWNLRTGVATTSDLESIRDCTPDTPAYDAPTATRRTDVEQFVTCRYLDVLVDEDRWEVFAEVARKDEAFELRHTTVKTHGT